jgi:hypothetical protein
MEKKMVRISQIIFLILVLVSLVVLGCRQAPPPGQTPPPGSSAQMPQGGSAQMPAPGSAAQMPAPAATAQMPPASSAQMPAPAGTVPASQAGAPSRDANQVLIGMTPEQVQQIMGSPDQLYQKGFIEWKYSNPQGGRVDIRFQNNKVLLVETYKNP